jgi:predicted enzyme related to lactoylglutathione lyase
MANDAPTFGQGKICYLVIPTTDIEASATFYKEVFSWRIRKRDDGSIAFDDGVGQVSGTWVIGPPPSTTPGVMIYIMVTDAAAAIDSVVTHGGKIVQKIDSNSREITAHFSDPGGNILGIYQERGLSK